MLLSGGSFNGRKIISQEDISMMTKSYSKVDGDPFDYGFSLFVLRDPELDGTNSSIVFLDGLGIIIHIFGSIRRKIYSGYL